MAVGIYTLPICDGCKLPWLPVGWTQDSDPRNPEKPLRCGKCKSIGWDREFVKAQKEGIAAIDVSGPPFVYAPTDAGVPDEELSDDELRTRYAIEVVVNPFDPTKSIEMPRNLALNNALSKIVAVEMPSEMGFDGDMHPPSVSYENVPRGTSEAPKSRCKHRMTDCPICHPKEAA
jgi:hypothetical protein